MTIAILNYDMGNIRSISNALRVVSDNVVTVSSGSELESPEAVVVPGVGSFADGMSNLEEKNFLDPLKELVIDLGTPYLGICLGLQFLAEKSEERGSHQGLGWIPGEVRRINPENDRFSVPHMGWNNTELGTETDSVLFRDFDSGGTFYFVHSYHLDPETTDKGLVTATSWHGTDITAAVRKDNMFGVQFHPEKSQGAGLKVLENFVEYAEGGGET